MKEPKITSIEFVTLNKGKSVDQIWKFIEEMDIDLETLLDIRDSLETLHKSCKKIGIQFIGGHFIDDVREVYSAI